MGPTLFSHTASLPESPAGTWSPYCPKGPQNIVVSIAFNSSEHEAPPVHQGLTLSSGLLCLFLTPTIFSFGLGRF